MTVPQTPTSSAERKRAVRLKIASRVYKALVAKNPNRVITLRDSGGCIVARHDPWPEQPVSKSFQKLNP
jgi:hypothetical protein